MADQEQRILVNEDLRPAYYDDFHCLAEECRYSCCKDWLISFDKKDYLRLKQQKGSPEFNVRMEGAIHRIRKDPPAGHYGAFDMHTGVCPLLREDCLCDLQVEKGAEALPMVCQTFPRREYYSPGYLERSLTPACEGVLAFLWNLPEGIEFRSDTLRPDQKKIIFFHEKNLLSPYFTIIREWCIDVLQDRRHSLPDRIMMLGMGLRQLADGEQDLPSWLHRAREIPEDTNQILPLVPEHRALQEYLSNCLGILMGMAAKNQNFHELRNEIFKGLGVKLTYDGWERLDATIQLNLYQEASKRYADCFGDRDYFLENLMVTLFFHLSLPDLSSPERIWKSYANFCSLYSMYRFMSVMSCRKEVTDEKAELLRLMVYTSRSLIHNQMLQSRLQDELFQNNSSTLAHMAILLCG